ncbi:glycosyltransferase [Thalassomonas sp. M1454]|uniref:glycosyltransferase n=1 Tax=Thalassomonas sp. M1454 TaxID=2594477 RepID=UPI00117CA17D|nr:glycosyltransferase family 2 protein [Thalassomonas sp. M1454]TRX57935.1 glycosyltransferase family 2 protein [Thalassomonas sp. M1454]
MENKINIAVFAHNESDSIVRCLQSIVQATSSPEKLNVKVLVNGCIDDTALLVNNFSKQYPQFQCVEISLGDKSNAWNHYLYSDIDESQFHFFMDGDNWLPALMLDHIESVGMNSNSIGIAMIPIGVSESLRAFLAENRFISGNFYGVSPRFIQEVKRYNFKLPVGYIGDDSLVMYLLEKGFDYKTGLDENRIIEVIESSGPVIPRIKISIKNLKMLHTRYKRYALRHFQQEVFYFLAKQNRLDELPEQAELIKKYMFNIGWKPYLSFYGIQTFYHPYAFFKILTS